MQRGTYVVFEGAGFSGKTTVLGLVADELRKKGLKVVETREPGGCEEAEAIRKMIFGKKTAGELTPKQETDLFYIARVINMTEVVLPAIEKGWVVLKDRDYMSTCMYQMLSGMSRDELINKHRGWYVKWGFPKPDLRLVLRVNEAGVAERMSRGLDDDPFDRFALEMVRLYGSEMLEISRGRGLFAKNTEIVNANLPVDWVTEKCLTMIEDRLGLEEDNEGERRGVEY